MMCGWPAQQPQRGGDRRCACHAVAAPLREASARRATVLHQGHWSKLHMPISGLQPKPESSSAGQTYCSATQACLLSDCRRRRRCRLCTWCARRCWTLRGRRRRWRRCAQPGAPTRRSCRRLVAGERRGLTQSQGGTVRGGWGGGQVREGSQEALADDRLPRAKLQWCRAAGLDLCAGAWRATSQPGSTQLGGQAHCPSDPSGRARGWPERAPHLRAPRQLAPQQRLLPGRVRQLPAIPGVAHWREGRWVWGARFWRRRTHTCSLRAEHASLPTHTETGPGGCAAAAPRGGVAAAPHPSLRPPLATPAHRIG